MEDWGSPVLVDTRVLRSNSRFRNSPNAGSCRIKDLQASQPNRMIRKPGKIAKPGIAGYSAAILNTDLQAVERIGITRFR